MTTGNTMRVHAIPGVLVAGLLMASSVSADTILPAASTELAAQGDTHASNGAVIFSESASNADTPGSVDLVYYDGGAEVVFGPPNSLGLPNPFAIAHIVDGANEIVSAHANGYYYFEIAGTGANPIPLDIQYSLFAAGDVVIEGGGTTSADAAVYVYNGNGTPAVYGNGTPGQVGADAHCNVANCNLIIAGVLHMNVFPNSLYKLQVHAAAGSNAANGIGSAEVDPYLYIDPGFANAADFQIVLSPGVGNAPVVPIPATAWLLGSALGLLGWLRRKPAI